MQLDRTELAVRERAMPEILDLALRVICAYWRPLLATWAIGVVPMMIINHLLLGFIADIRYDDLAGNEEGIGQIVRYMYDMSLLVSLEAPLATVLMTSYLGQAVFLEPPKLRALLADVGRLLPRVLLCLGVYRGVFAAWLLLLTLDRNGYEPFTFVEGLLLLGIAVYAAILRSVRPFISEIILLERNPLRGRTTGAMTIHRRSSLLHNPTAMGDLMLRWMGSALVACLLLLMLYGSVLAFRGLLVQQWSINAAYLVVLVLPLCMWLVAGYFAVVRYLAYLDLRIRQEGWEIELKMRAEAVRLAGKLA